MVQASIFSVLAKCGVLLRIQANRLSVRCASVHRHPIRYLLCVAAALFVVYCSSDELPSLGTSLRSHLGSRFVPATDLSDGDAIDFRCKMPESMRLQGNCWIKGNVGEYEGDRSEDGKMPNSRSLFGEDEFLFEYFFFNRTGGTFLEMGGLDGLHLSNSYFFETQMDWRGFMIEGSPKLAEKLFENRPKALTVNAMVCGEKRDLHWMDKGPTGGAYELLPQRIIDKFYGPNVLELVAKAPLVPCVPLGKLLRRFGIQHVDLFSLDVEGSELSVLKTIDFSAFTASVILMEVQSTSKHTAPAVNHMRSLGYFEYGALKSNYIFLHPRFVETLPRPLKRPEGMSLVPGV